MTGERTNVISLEQYKTLKYPAKIRYEADFSPTQSLALEQYTAGVAAMAEPGMSAADAIMHFFWTIADNNEDSADDLMTKHAQNHGFPNKDAFYATILPMVGTQMLMLQGKVIAANSIYPDQPGI